MEKIDKLLAHYIFPITVLICCAVIIAVLAYSYFKKNEIDENESSNE